MQRGVPRLGHSAMWLGVARPERMTQIIFHHACDRSPHAASRPVLVALPQMKKTPFSLHLSVVAAALALAGCSSDPPAGDTGPLTFADCDAIIEACHAVDDGSPGMIATCHDTAHDATSNADCAPLSATCVAACAAVDGGVVHDEDAPEHSHDEDAGAH